MFSAHCSGDAPFAFRMNLRNPLFQDVQNLARRDFLRFADQHRAIAPEQWRGIFCAHGVGAHPRVRPWRRVRLLGHDHVPTRRSLLRDCTSPRIFTKRWRAPAVPRSGLRW